MANPRHAARRTCDLGGQHGLLARTRCFFKPVANDGFGSAKSFCACGHRIHFGCVQEVDAVRQGAIQDGVGIGFPDLLAKSHGAQTNGGDVQAAGAELDFVHDALSVAGSIGSQKMAQV